MDLWPALDALAGALSAGGLVAVGYFALIAFVAMVAIFSAKRSKRAREVLAMLVRIKRPPDG